MSPAAPAPPPTVRPRPAVFRALGRDEPPTCIAVAGQAYRLDRVYKHDSWAATALYAAEPPLGEAPSFVVAKINRCEPVALVPMRWLGRRLAAREAAVYERMTGVPGVPRYLGRVGDTGLAHAFVPGDALSTGDEVDPGFLDRLDALVGEFHARGVAIVDLQKAQNILRGEDDRPYLFDFQIAWVLPERGLGRCWPMRRLYRLAIACDLYHLRKHRLRYLRHTLPPEQRESLGRRPWYIRLHRTLTRPLQRLRRGLLVWLGVRDRTGKAATELHAEPGIARRRPHRAASIKQREP